MLLRLVLFLAMIPEDHGLVIAASHASWTAAHRRWTYAQRLARESFVFDGEAESKAWAGVIAGLARDDADAFARYVAVERAVRAASGR